MADQNDGSRPFADDSGSEDKPQPGQGASMKKGDARLSDNNTCSDTSDDELSNRMLTEEGASLKELFTPAWESLKLELCTDNETIDIKCPKNLEPCMLQHIFDSDTTKRVFQARLSKNVTVDVKSPGYVVFRPHRENSLTSSQISSAIIEAITGVLRGTICAKVTFKRRVTLESVAQQIDDLAKKLLSDKDVGGYLTIIRRHSSIPLTLVGQKVSVELLVEAFTHSECGAEPVFSALETNEGNTGKLYSREDSFGPKMTEYLDVINVKQSVQDAYPGTTVRTSDADKIIIEGTNSKDVDAAWDTLSVWLKGTKVECYSSHKSFVIFAQSEQVMAYLQAMLKKIPAYAVCTADTVELWAPDKESLKKARGVVDRSLRHAEVTGEVSAHAKHIIDSSSGKIKVCTVGQSRDRYILYTSDVEKQMIELKDEIEKWCWLEKFSCSFVQYQALIMFEIKIEEVVHTFSVETGLMTLGSKTQESIDKAVEVIKKFFTCLKYSRYAFPEGSVELMKHEKVTKYVKEKLKVKDVHVCTDIDGQIYLVCLTAGQDVPFEKTLFVSTMTVRDFVESEERQNFIEKHKEEILIKTVDDKKIYLCMTEDLFHDFMEKTSVFCRTLNASMIHYLSTYGTELKTKLEKQYGVKIEIDGSCVRCCGNSKEQCMEELENRITVSLLHFEDGTRFHKSLARGSKKKMDLILEKQRVGFKVIDDVTTAQGSPAGISYYMKWSLANNGGKVSVAEVDFCQASGFDVVVIPVNSCLFGEDIYMNGTKEIRYVEKEPQQTPKKALGSRHLLSKLDKQKAKCHIALVYADVVADPKAKSQSPVSISKDQTKHACERIFHWMLQNRHCKVAFAIPQNDQVILRNAEVIIRSFLETSYKSDSATKLDLLICVKTDPVKMIQMVDHTLQTASRTRRKTFPCVAGLFIKPTVTIKVLQKSLLDVKASCYAVSVSNDMNMKKGLAREICTRAGSGLQSAVQSKSHTPLKHGGVVSFDSYDLKSRGVQKLLFGHLEDWHKCKDAMAIEDIIVECLLRAESMECTSVAFPVLGTGHLAYPPRDVIAAMFDGVQKYVDITMQGRITDVSFAVSENDENLYELLKIEEGRRETDSKIEIPPFKDISYLEAKNSEPKVRIINLEHIELLSPAGSLQVIFDPTEGTAFQVTGKTTQQMMISCDKSKRAFDEALTMLVRICEKEKITSVVINLTEGIGIPLIDQADVITQAMKSQSYLYLKNVLLATKDFEKVAEMKLCDKKGEPSFIRSVSSILLNRDVVWEKHFHSTAKMCTNIIFAGQEPGVNAAKEEIHKLFQKETIAVPDELGEVSAEVNPGIIEYLVTSENIKYEAWEKQIEDVFGIVFQTVGKVVTVRGILENIMTMESYLEERFPEPPIHDRKNVPTKYVPLDEKHFTESGTRPKTKSFLSEDHSNKSVQKFPSKSVTAGIDKSLRHFSLNIVEMLFTCDYKQDFKDKSKSLNSDAHPRIKAKCCDIADIPADFLVMSVEKDLSCAIAYENPSNTKSRSAHLALDKAKEKVVRSPKCGSAEKDTKKTDKEKIELLVRQCLKEADQLKAESVAFPNLYAADEDTADSQTFIKQLLKTVSTFGTKWKLLTVFLVESNSERFLRAVQFLSTCIQEDKEFGVLSSTCVFTRSLTSDIKLHIALGSLAAVSVDSVIIVADTEFSDISVASYEVYKLAGNSTREAYTNIRHSVPGTVRVECIPANGGGLTNKYLVVVSPPAWKTGRDSSGLWKHLQETAFEVLATLRTVKEIQTLAMSSLYSDESDSGMLLSARAIKEALVGCGGEIHLKEIHFLCRQKNQVLVVLDEMLKGSKHGGKFYLGTLV